MTRGRGRRVVYFPACDRFVSQQAVRQLGLAPDDHGIVTAHLGNGCSCTAVRDGQSLDTTMGLTPLEAVVMATNEELMIAMDTADLVVASSRAAA